MKYRSKNKRYNYNMNKHNYYCQRKNSNKKNRDGTNNYRNR